MYPFAIIVQLFVIGGETVEVTKKDEQLSPSKDPS